MQWKSLRRGVVIAVTALSGVSLAAAAPAGADSGGAYVERAVVVDHGRAPVVDTNLVNPWGIAFGARTPLWVANNGTSTSTIYSSNHGFAQVPLVVHTQPAPTGIVINPTTEFRLPDQRPGIFLFDSLTGQLSAWGPGDTSTTVVANVPGAVFTGLAIGHSANGERLYAADAAGTTVRVFDGSWNQVGTLSDPQVPAGLTTYGVAVLRRRVYVTYAVPPGGSAAVQGAIDIYSLSGRLIKRLVTSNRLTGAWGMALAPSDWGQFSGALLVGNEDGGRINAFDKTTGRFLGTVRDTQGRPLGADGLWGLAFGNGVFGSHRDLIISIGTSEYAHGVVAFIRPTG